MYESPGFQEFCIFMVQSETAFLLTGSTNMLTGRNGRLGIVGLNNRQRMQCTDC